MSPVVIGLIGLVVGSVLQAATGWISDARASKREHRQWLRDRRHDAYRDVVQKAWGLAMHAGTSEDAETDAYDSFHESLLTALLVSSNKMQTTLNDINMRLIHALAARDTDDAGDAYGDLISAVRNALA